MSKLLALTAIVIISTGAAAAQVATGAVISGTVIDSGQRALAGAVVTITSTSTGVTDAISTNNLGQYRSAPLQIGGYTVSIERDGFKQYREIGVNLDIGAVREINAVLLPGQVVETVEVQGGTEELLQKSDSTVGTVITNEQVAELPLNGGSNGRDYLQLATLSAGTTPAVGTSGGISIAGQQGSQVAFLLDGLDNNNQQILTSHTGQKEVVKPSVDAVSEFKVVTTSYAAEYGRSSSGVVSVDLKSGSNQVHGSGFEFLRNDAVDALPDFSASKLPFKYNDFGGTLGAPIRRNRAFVFGDVEFFRLRAATTTYGLVPTAAQKLGQFATPVYQPDTFNGASRTPFVNNQLSGALDSVAQSLLKYFPAPNGSFAGGNNYFYNKNGNTNNYRWDTRVDDALSNNQSIFGRYSSQQDQSAVSATLPPLNGQFYAGSGAQNINSQAFAIGYNNSFTPHLLGAAAAWLEQHQLDRVISAAKPYKRRHSRRRNNKSRLF